jgi:tetratricopeptide (TPR) repeat protein
MLFILRGIFCSAIFLGGAFSAGAQSPVEMDLRVCLAMANQDTQIDACTRVIDNPAAQDRQVVAAFIERAYAFRRRSEWRLALIDADRAVELQPGNWRTLFLRAQTNYDMRNYEASIVDYDAVLRINPQNVAAFYNRGLAYQYSGNREMALANYEAALKLRPRYALALMNRGFLSAGIGNYEAALKDYDAALASEPTLLRARIYRAEAFDRLERYSDAVAEYQAIVDGPQARPGNKDDLFAKRVAGERLEAMQRKVASGTRTRPAPVERRVALVIGNSGYAHAGSLKNPENDAKAIAKTLKEVGFTEVRERFNLPQTDLVKELKEFGDVAQQSDWAVIYFSGHGIEHSGTNFLVPIDAKLERPEHVEDEAVSLKRMLDKVSGAAKMQLVIFDACRVNPFVQRLRERSGRMTRSIARGLAPVEPDNATLVVYAARDGTVALDGEGNLSPFAEALTMHMVEPGLEISLLFRKVRDSVMGKTARQQEPFTYGSLPAQALYFKAK